MSPWDTYRIVIDTSKDASYQGEDGYVQSSFQNDETLLRVRYYQRDMNEDDDADEPTDRRVLTHLFVFRSGGPYPILSVENGQVEVEGAKFVSSHASR